MSAIFVVAIVAEWFEDDPNGVGMFGAALGAVSCGTLAVSRVVAERRAATHPAVGGAEPVAASRLPGRKSTAWAPMRRLAGAETALRDLLRQLDDASVPRDVVDAARRTAAETADRLRVLAAKVEAVEAAVAYSPADQRAGLEEGTRNLLAHLEGGLDGYQGLVAAAGHLVLADSANPVPDGLVEATDHLAGLASALRELSRDS
jgi:hypothetical protein